MEKPNQKIDSPQSVNYDRQVLNKSYGKKGLTDGIKKIGMRNTWEGREKLVSPDRTLGAPFSDY